MATLTLKIIFPRPSYEKWFKIILFIRFVCRLTCIGHSAVTDVAFASLCAFQSIINNHNHYAKGRGEKCLTAF